MKLNEFISNLLDMVNEKPELGGLEVISENSPYDFELVESIPTLVKADFSEKKDVIYALRRNVEQEEANAIIIN